MKRYLTRRNGLIALALVLISIPATMPFWHPDFIFTADSPLHLWRVYELDRALREGVFYPRWAPDLYFGYGYPVFNFYPPFSYYLVETLHVPGLDLANAFKAVFSFCVLLGAAGAFLLARDIYRDGLTPNSKDSPPPGSNNARSLTIDAGALVAAVAFAYAPYLLIDIYIRGAIAETLGLAFLPLFLWALRRVLIQPRAGRIALAVVIGAVYLLSHNLTAFFSAPILAVYVLLLVFQQPVWRERWRRLGAAVLVALGTAALSAFYWLPSLVELPMVYVGQPALSRQALLQTILDHIQPIGNVIQHALVYEYPEGSFPLGSTSVILAVSGAILGIYWLRRRVQIELAFFWIVSILAALALTEAARPVWLALPTLWVIQFTWRLTVFVIPGMSLAMGLWVIAAYRLAQRSSRTAIVALATAALLGLVLILTSTLNLASKPWFTAMPAYNVPQVLARYEVDFRQTGMSSMNEYLPVWTRNVPLPDGRRKSPSSDAPSGAIIELISVQPTRYQFTTRSSEPFTLSLRKFYYPDWYAWLDDQPAPVEPSTNVGLLSVEVPAGEHHIRFERNSLPVRDVGWVLTGVGILTLVAWWIFAIRRGDRSWLWSALAFGMAFLAFFIPHLLSVFPAAPPFTPTQIDVDPTLRLVGLTTDSTVPSIIQVRLYWQVKQRIAQDQLTKLQLVDADGKVWTTRRQLSRYGTAGSQYWMANQLIEDWYELFVPQDMPAGTYTLQIARGEVPWQTAGTVQLNSARARDSVASISQPLNVSFGNNIRMLGYNAPSQVTARAGDRLPMTLFWQASGDVSEDYSVFVHLLDRDSNLSAQEDSLPNNGFTPSMLWAPGETIPDQHTLTLPRDIRPGEYQLVTGLYRFRDLSRLPVFMDGKRSEDDFVPLATIKVTADRPFQPQYSSTLRLGSAIRLQGFSWAARDRANNVFSRVSGGTLPTLATTPGSQLELDVEWHADAKPERDYTVFVHLVDSAGKVVRQKDNPPVDGYYPTHIWESGERVIDAFSLPLQGLPAGEYKVLIGMYDSETLERLPVVDAGGNILPNNAAELGRILIESK